MAVKSERQNMIQESEKVLEMTAIEQIESRRGSQVQGDLTEVAFQKKNLFCQRQTLILNGQERQAVK